jgi:hypothetical protein
LSTGIVGIAIVFTPGTFAARRNKKSPNLLPDRWEIISKSLGFVKTTLLRNAIPENLGAKSIYFPSSLRAMLTFFRYGSGDKSERLP